VSHQKYSEKEVSDLDIVCVSDKAAFWPIEQLLEGVNRNTQWHIDLSIVTVSAFVSLLRKNNSSSLAESFRHGFTIMYQEG
jgi:hypothetical protein